MLKPGHFSVSLLITESRGEVAAKMAEKIFKGSDPARMPVRRPKNVKLSINKKIAKRLGIKINQEILRNAVLY